MGRHTPGPWHARNHRDAVSGEVRDEGGLWIARVHHRDGESSSSPECVANTHLIAAAPDLLAEHLRTLAQLERMAQMMSHLRKTDEMTLEIASAIKATRAVIARAEGRMP